MFALLNAMVFSVAFATGTLNPALAPTRQDLEHVWQAGYERAGHDRDTKGALKLAQRGIGSFRNGFSKRTVSWLTFEHPRLTAFQEGFKARKQQWTEAEAQASRDRLTGLADGHLGRLTFHGQVGLYPGLVGARIRREADPDDVKDVRVLLRVGDRTYQPVEQPGDLEAQAYEGHLHSEVFVPNRTRRHHTQGTIPVEVRYTWYKGDFDVAFDLRDPDGTPRITDRDKEFTVIVILRAGERRATFRLDEWLAAYER